MASFVGSYITNLVIDSSAAIFLPCMGEILLIGFSALAYLLMLPLLRATWQRPKVLKLQESNAKVSTPKHHISLTPILESLKKCSSSSECVEEFLAAVDALSAIPPKSAGCAVAHVLEECVKGSDYTGARLVEDTARKYNFPFHTSAYHALLKLGAQAGDTRVSDLFQELQRSGKQVSDSLCTDLLTRCGSNKFLRFADEVVAFLRAKRGMTVQHYGALMNVYSSCGMIEEACNVYEVMVGDGKKPDSQMLCCLTKLAISCGRQDLLKKIRASEISKLDSRACMSRLRALAAANKIDDARTFFEEIKAAGEPDSIMYNFMMDIYVSAGQNKSAFDFLFSIPADKFDVHITFNTLLKGHCKAGDIAAATDAMGHMKAAGHTPQIIAYNCILNMFVNIGPGQEGRLWELVDEMQSNGIKPDHFTVATVAKMVDLSYHKSQCLSKVLALLDASNVVIWTDEVVIVLMLQVCMKYRRWDRVRDILEKTELLQVKCSAKGLHTYGLFIKAYGLLHRVDKCREIWGALVVQRSVAPTDLLTGCMLDALVRNDCVDEAYQTLTLLERQGIKPNAIMYRTILKGYVAKGDSSSARSIVGRMRSCSIQLTDSEKGMLGESRLLETRIDFIS